MGFIAILLILTTLFLYILPMPKDTTVQWIIDGNIKVGGLVSILYGTKIIFFGKVEEIPKELYSLRVHNISKEVLKDKGVKEEVLIIYVSELNNFNK